MTVADFDHAAVFLKQHDIDIRAFLLLKPPGLSEREGVEWGMKSMQHAFDMGVQCCSFIPTRVGNGYIDRLQANGRFQPPTIRSMEILLEQGIALKRGRVLMDLWDVEKFYDCPDCGPARSERIRQMNLTQQIAPKIDCICQSKV